MFHTKQSDVFKKKSTALGGIESIVRRLHKVRSDTPDTSQPGSDNEGYNSLDNVKVKTEPEETCNNDDAASAAIPKKATTAIYSSGRNGRKRVFVKREPDADAWIPNQHDSALSGSHDDQQQVSDYANHWSPVHIKQEKLDPDDAPMVDSNQSAGSEEKPRTLGQFVRNAASWVSQLVATELEKPGDSAPAAAAAPGPEQETPETLFSDSRLHKIIEEQLGKASEPSVSEKRLHSVIEEQLSKPTPPLGSSVFENLDSAQSKAVRKEMKKARKEARHAKKLKKAQKREREKEVQKYRELQQSYSPFEKSISPYEKSTSPFHTSTTSNSPFDKSISPFEKPVSPFPKPSGQEPLSASNALESFARMVQIREFQGGSSLGIIPQQPPATPPQVSVASGIKKSPPVPTALHTNQSLMLASSQSPATPQSQSSRSPAPDIAETVPDASAAATSFATPDEHPASLALKSFAQRSETMLQAEPDVGGSRGTSPFLDASEKDAKTAQSADTATKSPLETLLKVAQPPRQSAKSQLEHLLKTKDIKAQWSKPASVTSSQQIPYHTTQAQTSSPHILKVPKVTLSGRTIKDTAGQDSLQFKGSAFDHVLAATGISSDSDDGDAQAARDRNTDPDWSSPRQRQRARKRDLGKSTHSAETVSPFALTSSQDMYNEAGAKQIAGVDEPAMKHQKLTEDGASSSWTNGSSGKSNELSATNTLARLLQMANKNNKGNQVQNNSSSVNPKKGTSGGGGGQGQSPSTPLGRNYASKQSAFGAMQAFAQMVEIQGKSPEKQNEIKVKGPEKLSDSLPPISADGVRTPPSSSKPKGVKARHDQNGGKYKNNYIPATKVNGRGMNNSYEFDEPEDLTMHSRIKIKMEPLDVDDVQEVADLSTNHGRSLEKNFQEEPMHYTCSLCSQIFSSKSEVTDHKLRIHYSSSFEIVS